MITMLHTLPAIPDVIDAPNKLNKNFCNMLRFSLTKFAEILSFLPFKCFDMKTISFT